MESNKCQSIAPHPTLDKQITMDEVKAIVAKHKIKSASGEDCISWFFLRNANDALFIHLAELFNLSLTRTVIPNDWKSAIIHPLYKSEDPSSAGNYRPICGALYSTRVIRVM